MRHGQGSDAARSSWAPRDGMDRSRPMLERAREKLAHSLDSGHAVLHEGSMTEADHAPGGPFGLVLFTLNGIMHLPTLEAQRRALAAAKHALDPRGMLVIDAHNPSPEFLAHLDGRVHHEGTWERADGAVVNRFAARTHSPARQRIETELWFDMLWPDGQVKRVRSRFPLRYLMPAELELLLELVGFAEWRLYGSYDLEPFGDESERLIVTAEVTPS